MNFDTLNERWRELDAINSHSVLGFTIGTLSNFEASSDFYLTPIRLGSQIKYFGVIVKNVATAVEISKWADGKFAFIFVDAEKKIISEHYGKGDVGNVEKAVGQVLLKSELLTFKGNDITAHSADAFLRVLLPNMTGQRIAVAGVGNIGAKIALALVERGNYVTLFSRNPDHARKVSDFINLIKPINTIGSCDYAGELSVALMGRVVLVATSDQKAFISEREVAKMASMAGINQPVLVDVGKGCFHQDLVSLEGVFIYRVDVEQFLTSELENLISLRNRAKLLSSRPIPGGRRLIKNGLVGRSGDVIVDNPTKPTKILGVCDGLGNLVSHIEVLSLPEINLILAINQK